jgi:hypothetical protein
MVLHFQRFNINFERSACMPCVPALYEASSHDSRCETPVANPLWDQRLDRRLATRGLTHNAKFAEALLAGRKESSHIIADSCGAANTSFKCDIRDFLACSRLPHMQDRPPTSASVGLCDERWRRMFKRCENRWWSRLAAADCRFMGCEGHGPPMDAIH